ncbi:hypothetical protein Hypma_009726 [Hypsizygus marmoreus]|uniref:G-protein coupled receptors family 1 profile domain-containing protein n=1 Tax=Hypsizygus marmoreus TaxID=39966 RepID=A0A369JUP2_HYPMA|nr:hypothetical protein Hypma_009726 [Hypsizygus marmoreus]
MSNSSQILNPLTPLGYLSPEAGFQNKSGSYIIIGTLAALLWDIINNINLEYQLLFKYKMSLPTFAYFLSRASVLTYTLVNAIARTAPLGQHCQLTEKIQCVIYHMAFSSTALLFFLRVRAIFKENKLVVAFFFILWLSVLGTSLTIAATGGASMIGPTAYCFPRFIRPYAISSPVTFTIHDSFVFLAISWRLMTSLWGEAGRKKNVKSIIFGKYLPGFSRAILQDGQVYYLISISSNILALILTFFPEITFSHGFMFVVNCTVTHMMACIVFRRTKFGNIREDMISTRFIQSHGFVDAEGTRELPSTSVSRELRPAGSTGDSSNLRSRVHGTEIVGDGFSKAAEGGAKAKRRSRFLILVSVMLILLPLTCVFLCTRPGRPAV